MFDIFNELSLSTSIPDQSRLFLRIQFLISIDLRLRKVPQRQKNNKFNTQLKELNQIKMENNYYNSLTTQNLLGKKNSIMRYKKSPIPNPHYYSYYLILN